MSKIKLISSLVFCILLFASWMQAENQERIIIQTPFKPVKTVYPDYPEILKKEGVAARVRLWIFIDRKGNVRRASVIRPYSLISKPKLLFGLTKENNIIWALSSKYEIQIINSGGELIRKIVKDHDPIKITDEDKKKITLRIYLRETIPPGQEAEFPKYFHPIDWIHVDNEDRIFVRTFENVNDKNSYYYDVFDPEGHYIAKVSLKAIPELPIIWKRNKLYTIEADEKGYQYIKRYKVTWKY